MSQILDRSISSHTHMFDFLPFYIWRYWCLWYSWLGKIARAIYDVEEATSTAFDIILEHKVDYLFSFIGLFVLIDLGDTTIALCLADDKTRNSRFTH